MSKKIYVLHEYGAPTHYLALQHLAQTNGYDLKFYELWSWKFVIKHPSRWCRYIVNKFFWIFLPFLPQSKIVLGIAPYNNRLKKIMRRTKKHEVYYHSSYTCWNGDFCVHKPHSDNEVNLWKEFTNSFVKHIFVVSEVTKKQLIINGFASEDRISVVNHSYNIEINAPLNKKKENTFIYVGRLSEQKGIVELLKFFSIHSDYIFTIVGNGPYKEIVSEYCKKYNNIKYVGYISGFSNILPYYLEHCFAILNSKRSKSWEELFGMSIIEGMSCGCVPICSDHSGPKEILTNNENGYIAEENRVLNLIDYVSNIDQNEYNRIRLNAIQKSKEYHVACVSDKWLKIIC